MSNQTIHTHGEDVSVREDTAKAFRGVNWAWASILGFIIIIGLVFAFFFWHSAKDGSIGHPSEVQDPRGQP